MKCKSIAGLPPSIKFAGTQLYTWMERVKCLIHERKKMFPARAQTRTARSGVECTNHESTMPPKHFKLQLPRMVDLLNAFLYAIVEAAWPSGLGCWIWNLEVLGSNPPPCCYLDLFSVVPSSTPRPRCVNSQLVSLPPVGIFNSVCSICDI